MKLINSIQTNHPNYSFSFYGAERLILHDRYGTVYIRSALRENNKEIISFFDDGKLETNAASILTLSSDQNLFASSHDDGIIRIWNIKGKKLISKFRATDSFIWSLKFINQGQSIIAGCGDGSIYIYNLEGELEKELSDSPLYSALSVDINPVNPEIIASASGVRGITVWDMMSEKEKSFQYDSGENGSIYVSFLPPFYKSAKNLAYLSKVKFLPNGSNFMSGDDNGLLCVWELETGKRIRTFDLSCYNSLNRINAIEILNNKAYIAKGSEVYLLSNFFDAQPSLVASMNQEVFDIAISPDGKLIAFGGYEPKIDVYSLDE